jgi:hypothetical protein
MSFSLRTVLWLLAVVLALIGLFARLSRARLGGLEDWFTGEGFLGFPLAMLVLIGLDRHFVEFDVKPDFAGKVTGCLFLAAALMLWVGWLLSPHHIGMLFGPGDFAAIGAHLHLWLWLFRVHIFGMVTAVLALIALAALLAESPARVLVWPGAAVASAGWIVGAVGAAFYYHFGVYGAIQMTGKSPAEVQAFVDSLLVSTEYVTCLVRFGRVFSGLGLLVLAVGLMKWQVVPVWLGASAAVIGTAAMAITMILPDNWPVYTPVFHLQALWLAAAGMIVLRYGICINPLL